ncbi:sentrin-specific protease 3-like, partial [Pseudonaja textilis]|uniref:sentrin-specific protease 3-like n=1 Tax=Pseudonaja textilis TaxID=8673 RepID=UPI000EAA8D05
SQPDDSHLPVFKKSCPLGVEAEDCQSAAKGRPHPSEPHLDYALGGAFPLSPSTPHHSRLGLLGTLMDKASPYPQYMELQRVSFEKEPGVMEVGVEEPAALLKYPARGVQVSPRTRKMGEPQHDLDRDGDALDALPNGFACLPPADGDLCSLPGLPDATILISNVCSIGGHVAEKLFQGSRDSERPMDPLAGRVEGEGRPVEVAPEEAEERPAENMAQPGLLREEHITCVHSILDKFLQAYGSLIPISVDEVVGKLEDIFQQEFSTLQRYDVLTTHTHHHCYPREEKPRKNQAAIP